MRSNLVAAAFVALLTVTSNARAQDKKVDICVGNFEEAQLKEKRGKLVEARELYAMCAAASCPSLVRTDCAAKRDRLDRATPTITIVVRDAAGRDLDATITVDGKPFSGDRTRAQPIDPGPHVVTYTAPGKQPIDENVSVYEGEQGRVVSITAKDAPAASSTTAPSPASAEQAGGAPKKSLVGPLIIGGVGVAGVAVGVVFQILSSSEQSKSEEFNAKANDPAQAPDDKTRKEFQSASDSRHSAAKNDQTLSLISFIGGVVFIGGAVLWYVLEPAELQKTGWIAPDVYRF